MFIKIPNSDKSFQKFSLNSIHLMVHISCVTKLMRQNCPFGRLNVYITVHRGSLLDSVCTFYSHCIPLLFIMIYGYCVFTFTVLSYQDVFSSNYNYNNTLPLEKKYYPSLNILLCNSKENVTEEVLDILYPYSNNVFFHEQFLHSS